MLALPAGGSAAGQLAGSGARILWVGKAADPQVLPAGAATLLSAYTAGTVEAPPTALAAGATARFTIVAGMVGAPSQRGSSPSKCGSLPSKCGSAPSKRGERGSKGPRATPPAHPLHAAVAHVFARRRGSLKRRRGPAAPQVHANTVVFASVVDDSYGVLKCAGESCAAGAWRQSDQTTDIKADWLATRRPTLQIHTEVPPIRRGPIAL